MSAREKRDATVVACCPSTRDGGSGAALARGNPPMEGWLSGKSARLITVQHKYVKPSGRIMRLPAR